MMKMQGKKVMLTGRPALVAPLVVTALDMLEFTKDAVAFLSKVSADAQVLILHGIQERLKEANLVVRPPMFFPLTMKEQAAAEQAPTLQQVKAAKAAVKDVKPRSGDPLKRSKAMKLAWKRRRAALAAAEKEKEQAKSKPKPKKKAAPAKPAAPKKSTKKKSAAPRAGAKKSKPAKSDETAPATEAAPATDDAAMPTGQYPAPPEPIMGDGQ